MADEELKRDARKAILDRIVQLAPTATGSGVALLAEAYAWTLYPNQSHGGPSAPR